jgi:hypothetical protein
MRVANMQHTPHGLDDAFQFNVRLGHLRARRLGIQLLLGLLLNEPLNGRMHRDVALGLKGIQQGLR